MNKIGKGSVLPDGKDRNNPISKLVYKMMTESSKFYEKKVKSGGSKIKQMKPLCFSHGGATG